MSLVVAANAATLIRPFDPAEIPDVSYLDTPPADWPIVHDSAWWKLCCIAPPGVDYKRSGSNKALRCFGKTAPSRYIKGQETAEITYTSMEWDSHSIPFMAGGDVIVEPDPINHPGAYMYEPPAIINATDEHTVAWVWTDKGYAYIVVAKRIEVGEGFEFGIRDEDAMMSPTTLRVLDPQDGTDLPLRFLSNDPKWSPSYVPTC